MINLQVGVSQLAGNVFKYGDLEASVCALAKEGWSFFDVPFYIYMRAYLLGGGGFR